jgi:hypothetical protein
MKIPTYNVLFLTMIRFNLVKAKITLFFFLIVGLKLNAQQPNFFSRSEIGVHIGSMYYIGDLNQFKPFYRSQLAGGFMYRFTVHSRLSLRVNYTVGNVEAYDSDSQKPMNINRNLDFKSRIRELAGGIEFNYFPFQIGSRRYPGTAYLITQVGLFYMEPKTTINGQEVKLQDIGTEGQGSALGKKRLYSNYQLCIPLGLGAKFTLGKRATFNVDIAIRKTFTDYIDDVGSDFYLDPSALAAANGQTAADLNNRSLDGNRYGRRGNSSTKDWYVYAGGMLTFRLGTGNVCPRLR